LQRFATPAVRWLICGGESGNPGQAVRPMEPEWARSARDQAASAGVPFWFKQWGQHSPDLVRLGSKREAGDVLDGRRWKQRPDWTALVRDGELRIIDCAEPVAV
jgi:protein gp37